MKYITTILICFLIIASCNSQVPEGKRWNPKSKVEERKPIDTTFLGYETVRGEVFYWGKDSCTYIFDSGIWRKAKWSDLFIGNGVFNLNNGDTDVYITLKGVNSLDFEHPVKYYFDDSVVPEKEYARIIVKDSLLPLGKAVNYATICVLDSIANDRLFDDSALAVRAVRSNGEMFYVGFPDAPYYDSSFMVGHINDTTPAPIAAYRGFSVEGDVVLTLKDTSYWVASKEEVSIEWFVVEVTGGYLKKRKGKRLVRHYEQLIRLHTFAFDYANTQQRNSHYYVDGVPLQVIFYKLKNGGIVIPQ